MVSPIARPNRPDQRISTPAFLHSRRRPVYSRRMTHAGDLPLLSLRPLPAGLLLLGPLLRPAR